jgi:hypothetical protein
MHGLTEALSCASKRGLFPRRSHQPFSLGETSHEQRPAMAMTLDLWLCLMIPSVFSLAGSLSIIASYLFLPKVSV